MGKALEGVCLAHSDQLGSDSSIWTWFEEARDSVSRDERLYPDYGNGNFAFHLSRYLWATPFAYDRTVLDAGCGAGYGAELLSTVAHSVVAVDYDADAVSENQGRYAYRTNLSFEVRDVTALAFPDESFDLIVSFEVYEHLEGTKSETFLRHLSRLCRAGGFVLLSTPNRLVEAPFMKSAGQVNQYHVNSVSPREFKARLQSQFKYVTLFGQRVQGPLLKRLLRAVDVFNLRHSLLSYDAKQRLNGALSGKSLSTRLELRDITIRRSLVRQSGVLLAVCSK